MAAPMRMGFSQAGHLIVFPAHSGLAVRRLPQGQVTVIPGDAAPGLAFGLAAGISSNSEQPGHLTDLPAYLSGAAKLLPHLQVTGMGMG